MKNEMNVKEGKGGQPATTARPEALIVQLPDMQVRVWSCREIIEEARQFLQKGGSEARREIVKTALALNRIL